MGRPIIRFVPKADISQTQVDWRPSVATRSRDRLEFRSMCLRSVIAMCRGNAERDSPVQHSRGACFVGLDVRHGFPLLSCLSGTLAKRLSTIERVRGRILSTLATRFCWNSHSQRWANPSQYSRSFFPEAWVV